MSVVPAPFVALCSGRSESSRPVICSILFVSQITPGNVADCVHCSEIGGFLCNRSCYRFRPNCTCNGPTAAPAPQPAQSAPRSVPQSTTAAPPVQPQPQQLWNMDRCVLRPLVSSHAVCFTPFHMLFWCRWTQTVRQHVNLPPSTIPSLTYLYLAVAVVGLLRLLGSGPLLGGNFMLFPGECKRSSVDPVCRLPGC